MYGGGSGVDQTLTIKSPIAGTVVERNINPGQELRPDQGGAPALFVVTDPTRLWVQIDAHETDLSVLSRGGKFKLRVPTYPEETFIGRLESVADFIDPQTRVIKARGSVDNAERRLKGEMLVTAVFDARGPRGVEVPARAVVFSEGSYYAFVERGKGSFERVPVVTGTERGGSLVIASGLVVGQVVVSEGTLLLQQVLKSGNSKSESE
jgi:cobalt-zinc-cadmium efflux system membrane fusion protein